MAITIIILCIFLSVILNIGTLQIGYLIGKKYYQETREDQYWDMCRQIAQYDDELSKYKVHGPLHKILTRFEEDDKRYIAHYKFKHHYTMTPEEMKLVDDDERVNNLYKEAEEISNNAGNTKEEEK
jgi:hypothetical protein